MNRIGLILAFFLLNACTYNVVQQQSGIHGKVQTVGISGLGAEQNDEGQAVRIGNDSPDYEDGDSGYAPPYSGSGYAYAYSRGGGGPIGPAYDPRAWNVPNRQVWRYRIR